MRRKSHSSIFFFILIISGLCFYEIQAKTSNRARLIFPRAFAIAIDDMGWNEGGSRGDSGGGWRVGLRRDFDVRDYEAVVDVAKVVGVRFQGVFLLAEMDRMNICAKYPTTTQQGEAFDNTANIDPSQLAMMKFIQDQAAWLEFGIHGVGHEHWIDGERRRAEWYNLEDNHPWPEQDMRDHLKCFKTIMSQYGWTFENGQSFPESFVPCAYGYHWNPNGEFSTGKLMMECGVKYVNTLFSQIPELNPPSGPNDGGFDHGVLVINRINYGNEWFETASLPKRTVEDYESDIIETHWANWLTTDDFLQPDLNQKWIAYFKGIQANPDHYLAKNTEQLFSQWLYQQYTTVQEKTSGRVSIDNRSMPKAAYQHQLLGNMVVALPLKPGEHIQKLALNGKSTAVLLEEAGYGYIYLPSLARKQYTLAYETGPTMMQRFVNHRGTYNVYEVQQSQYEMILDLKMYGTQTVHIHCERPMSVISDNLHLKILSQTYADSTGMLLLEISGRDMQGEKGKIHIQF